MASRKYDDKGNVVEVQEKGETVEKYRPLDSEKIGEETAQMFRDAQNFEELKTALLRFLDLEEA